MILIGNLSIKQRLLLSLLLFIVLILGISLFVLNGTHASDSAQDTVSLDRPIPGELIAQMSNLANQNRTLAVTAVQYDPRNSEVDLIAQPLSSLRPQVQRNLEKLDQITQVYLASGLTDEEQRLIDRITTDHQALVEKGLHPVFDAVEGDRFDDAAQLFYRELEPAFARYRDGLDSLKQLQPDVAAQE